MAKLAVARAEVTKGRLPAGRSPTVAEFLRSWLETSVKPRVRPLRYAGYKVNVEKHLVPTIGKIHLDLLTPLHVQEMMNRHVTAGLSSKSVAYIHQVLRTALGLAVRWELVSRNVARLVDRPRTQRKPISPFTPEEARTFLAASVATDSKHSSRLPSHSACARARRSASDGTTSTSTFVQSQRLAKLLRIDATAYGCVLGDRWKIGVVTCHAHSTTGRLYGRNRSKRPAKLRASPAPARPSGRTLSRGELPSNVSETGSTESEPA